MGLIQGWGLIVGNFVTCSTPPQVSAIRSMYRILAWHSLYRSEFESRSKHLCVRNHIMGGAYLKGASLKEGA